MSERLWVTWEIQRRNRSLSAQLDAELVELIVKAPRLLKYPVLLWRTFWVVVKKRPKILFVQNPSIVLSFASLFFARIVRAKLVVDEHNAGLFPLEGRSKLLNYIARFIVRWAHLVIVSNPRLVQTVEGWGGLPVTVPDPLPSFPSSRILPGKPQDFFSVLFVCTWSTDEPYKEVIAAARLAGDDLRLYMTGSFKGKVDSADLPPNVVLTGFLPEVDYVAALANSDAVMVLTDRDDCLNCGAYEAVSMQKPLILSDTKALRDYFRQGVVFTHNDAESIRAALAAVKANAVQLAKDVAALKLALQREWLDVKNDVEMKLADIAPKSGNRRQKYTVSSSNGP